MLTATLTFPLIHPFCFPGQIVPSDSTSNNGGTNGRKSVKVCKLAIVVPESMFIKIAEKVKRFDAHIGPTNTALQEAPEIFESISVNLAIDVSLGMVNDLMRIFAREAIIGQQGIAIECRTSFNVLLNFGLK